MKKYFILLLISLNAHSQTTMSMPNLADIKSFFEDNASNGKVQPKKYNFINKASNKKEANFMLFCYTDAGMEIPRYSNVGIVAWQGKFLATDVETVDGRFIRVPSDKCFIESVPKK